MHRVVLIATTCLILVGCAKDDPTGDPVSGSITGPNIPANPVAIGVFSNAVAGTDVKFGQGSASSSDFNITFTAPPPAAAMTSTGAPDINFGLAFIAVIDSSVTITDGTVLADDSDLDGYTARYAVIYRPDQVAQQVTWVDAFPTGYSCGVCVDAAGGETFDHYDPTSCTNLTIETATDLDTLDQCNYS